MVDAVTTKVLHNGTSRYVVKLTNISDGTGENAVVKVDISTLTGPTGSAPTKIAIEKIEGVVSGMRVSLYWNHTSDVLIATLEPSGQICLDWTAVGGLKDTGTGEDGDILLTTTGHSSGDSYDLTLYCRLVA